MARDTYIVGGIEYRNGRPVASGPSTVAPGTGGAGGGSGIVNTPQGPYIGTLPTTPPSPSNPSTPSFVPPNVPTLPLPIGPSPSISPSTLPYFPPYFSPSPILPKFVSLPASSQRNVKVAPIDSIQFDDSSVEIALITDLLFEDIGATELANISRFDLIDGQEVIYTPIKNLPVIRREFNPNNLITSPGLSDYFTRFGIQILSRGIYDPYFNDDGDLVIEIDSIGDGEEIQVQILSNGTIDTVE